jgi:PhoPQ-activated pathogenicity-related protein
VPNQPLVFNKDGKERVEDDLIAYCHIKFLETGDATWVTRLPMVNSAVRAMDAATEFLASEAGGKIAIKKFVVAGGSKRGWTTWLTGAVDPRVKAIVPVVIDVVNVRPSMMNHYAAYGFWAPGGRQLLRAAQGHGPLGRARMERLNKIEDPTSTSPGSRCRNTSSTLPATSSSRRTRRSSTSTT